MRADERDLESTFQIALIQFDDRPAVKRALIGLYRCFLKLLAELVRADARRNRGRV